MSSKFIHAQLGFCGGNSGDPIFTETFGTGIGNNSLPGGTTTYNYTTGFPNDGFYTVSNGTFGNGFDWHQIQDHTPNDVNGKCLIVNAATAPGEFYKTTINGLCETTTYQFSSWLINLVKVPGFCVNQGIAIPVNVSFEIWDSTDTNLLASGSTGNINETANPNWEEFGLVFQTLAGQTTVILKIINNGVGGCGNDLAIDDIEFKSCGDIVTVSDTGANEFVSLCSTQVPYVTTLTAIPDFSVYNSHFYQWQQSSDGVIWNDIPGENNQSIAVSISTSVLYRAKIAEVNINLNNPLCVSFSNEYVATVNQLPIMPTLSCWETASLNTMTCSWDITGTQDSQPAVVNCWDDYQFDTVSCSWVNIGVQDLQPVAINCWDNYQFDTISCAWVNTGSQEPEPLAINCWDDYQFDTVSCSWINNGIDVIQPVILNCWDNYQLELISCTWINIGVQDMEPLSLNCWDNYQFNETSCSWENMGIQDLKPTVLNCWDDYQFDTVTCSWVNNGTQEIEPSVINCWDNYQFDTITCSWLNTGIQPGNVTEEIADLCLDSQIVLQPQTNILNPTYVWSTGKLTESIMVDTSGKYTVNISGGTCNFETIIFNVNQIELPIIESIDSKGSDIVIQILNTGDFLYSLDGNIFQSSPVFHQVEGGLYTIYVKAVQCDDIVKINHLHFYIPKYFTPNNDGKNDVFDLSGIEYYGDSQVSIFNRYGKLLKFSRNGPFFWDGLFHGEKMPTDDYWYVIQLDDKKFTGNFTLKR